ncbi:MAG: PD-(D/E)XK nuclease family protein [Acidimicrobiia bacterium]|nr:PD-(D/E)XK nuclease family protein [Acidimicrobiia bacterium]
MIDLMAETPSHLSPSSAAAFDQCPRRWRFKYIDRQPEPSHQAALVGSFAHRVLEFLCGLPARHRTTEQAKALAKELWTDFADDPDYQALELGEAEARAFRWQAWLSIMGLWDLEDPARVDVVSTEQKVTVELGGVPFVGVIDRVDRCADRLVVSDYKSGTLPGVRWRSDKIQQVMLYAAALARTADEQPERARLLYLGQRILDVAVTDRRIEEAEGQLSETWTAVSDACSTDGFEAKPSVLCGWCPFVSQCPEGTAELARRSTEGTLPAHAPAAALVA